MDLNEKSLAMFTTIQSRPPKGSKLLENKILHSGSVGGASAPLDFENGVTAPLDFDGNFQYI